MSKHKKTRKEKIIADYRHQVYILKNTNISPPASTAGIGIINKDLYPQSYILHDVLKTGLLTFSIIAAQLVLFFLLKNHILKIPGIAY